MLTEEMLPDLRNGKAFSRPDWKGDTSIAVGEGSKGGEPVINQTAGGKVVPWNPSMADFLADDWEEAESDDE